MIQHRAGTGTGAKVHGGTEALWKKLDFVEEKDCARTDLPVTGSVLAKWMKEFDTQKAKIVMTTQAKASTETSTFCDIMARREEAALQVRARASMAAGRTEERDREDLFQCNALPFGWNDSPQIFVKLVRVLVECLHSPRSAAERKEVRKLRGGSKLEANVGGRGVVAPTAGSEPVEWAEDLAQPHESQATHRLLPVCLGRGVKPEACGAGVLGGQAPASAHRASEAGSGVQDRDILPERVDRFASVLSAPLPRYYAQWYHPGGLFSASRLGGFELLGASSWDGFVFRISAIR
ncbi:hypothetical protein CYMTET_31721 [Cymbomonas tetramitiformis]|uniref:Uncharacterized protein n=1 Tax=Cymbomonas tetramitiformis TaxID=36881 RepID=A0AAE0FGX0_9CHLO|nr:hypothetical protein CYMTET_31721 [Cymbomonas tetramitiformis]